MSIHEKELLEQAWLGLERAYAPYSKYRVGAAVQTESGDIFVGCNVENASYGGTICAERVALTHAVSTGKLAPGKLAAILVAVESDEPAAPCGICRQFIAEFASPDTPVLLSINRNMVSKSYRFKDLLPDSFTSNALH